MHKGCVQNSLVVILKRKTTEDQNLYTTTQIINSKNAGGKVQLNANVSKSTGEPLDIKLNSK